MSKVEVGVAPPGAGLSLGVRMEAATVARALGSEPYGEWVLVRDFEDLGVPRSKFVKEVKNNLKDKSASVYTMMSDLGLHFRLSAKRTRKNPAETLRGSATIAIAEAELTVTQAQQKWVEAVNDALDDKNGAGATRFIVTDGDGNKIRDVAEVHEDAPVSLESDYSMNAAEQESDEYDELDSDDPNWVDPDEHLYINPADLVVNYDE